MEHLSQSHPPVAWETRGDRLEAECKVFEVHKRTCYHPRRDKEAEFYVIHAPDWVQAIPLTTDGRLIMVRQYRYGSEAFSWEVPGGVADPGENPVATAERELREETGFTGKSAQSIGTCSPNPAILTNRTHFILIEGCELTHEISLDEHEEIEVALFGVDEALELAAGGGVDHAIAINSLFFLQAVLRDRAEATHGG